MLMEFRLFYTVDELQSLLYHAGTSLSTEALEYIYELEGGAVWLPTWDNDMRYPWCYLQEVSVGCRQELREIKRNWLARNPGKLAVYLSNGNLLLSTAHEAEV